MELWVFEYLNNCSLADGNKEKMIMRNAMKMNVIAIGRLYPR